MIGSVLISFSPYVNLMFSANNCLQGVYCFDIFTTFIDWLKALLTSTMKNLKKKSVGNLSLESGDFSKCSLLNFKLTIGKVLLTYQLPVVIHFDKFLSNQQSVQTLETTNDSN